MPDASRAQQRKFHAMESRGDIAPSVVKEFDDATDFKHLPERAGKTAARHAAIRDRVAAIAAKKRKA